MSRILVLDDDTAVRTAIQLVLEREGHEVVLARNGRAGLSLSTELGAAASLRKPFRPHELLNAVNRRIGPRRSGLEVTG